MQVVEPHSAFAITVYGVAMIASVVMTPLIGIIGPFNGGNAPTPNEVYFLPAGYVFSVWGLIYGGFILIGVWMIRCADVLPLRFHAAAPWLVTTALGNVAWIAFAGRHQWEVLTVPMLLVMELSAWMAYVHLGLHQSQKPWWTRTERLLHIPLRVYVGWLSVATVANTASVLGNLNWGGFGISPVIWTVMMLGVATAVAGIVGYFVNEDNVYRAVFVWAFIGIAVKQWATQPVAMTALLMSAILVVTILFSTFSNKYHQLINHTS